MTQRLGAALSGLLLLAGATAGCKSEREAERQDASPRVSTPSLQAPSPDARSTADAKALAAYRGMWSAYAAAGETADPTRGDLAQYTTGEALKALSGALDGYRK